MLIIDGNSVFEIDCDCAEKRGLFQKDLAIEKDHIQREISADTGRRCVKKQTYTGEHVRVAVLDTGIYPHPDFGNRIVGWYDAVAHRRDPCDWNGHGTQEGVTGNGSAWQERE